jgi:hypothetical protein
MNENQSALIQLVDKIEQLGQFQDKIDFPASSKQIWDVFLEDVRTLIELEGCALFMVDDNHEFSLTYAMPESLGPVCQKEIESQIEYGIFPWIVRRRQPALIPAFAFDHDQSVVMLPLATAKRTLGMVMVLTPLQKSLVTQENLRLLGPRPAVLAGHGKLAALRPAAAQRRSWKAHGNPPVPADASPGATTAGMNEHLGKSAGPSATGAAVPGLTTTTSGHQRHPVTSTATGSCGFVKSLNELIRTDSDWLARYGGEEFLLVLPETALENAERLAERLRAHIAGKVFDWEGEKITITASFGVLGFSAGQLPKYPRQPLNRADKHLYQPKAKAETGGQRPVRFEQVVINPRCASFAVAARTISTPRSANSRALTGLDEACNQIKWASGLRRQFHLLRRSSSTAIVFAGAASAPDSRRRSRTRRDMFSRADAAFQP